MTGESRQERWHVELEDHFRSHNDQTKRMSDSGKTPWRQNSGCLRKRRRGPCGMISVVLHLVVQVSAQDCTRSASAWRLQQEGEQLAVRTRMTTQNSGCCTEGRRQQTTLTMGCPHADKGRLLTYSTKRRGIPGELLILKKLFAETTELPPQVWTLKSPVLIEVTGTHIRSILPIQKRVKICENSTNFWMRLSVALLDMPVQLQAHAPEAHELEVEQAYIQKYYPEQEKEPSPRFAARRTLFDLVISCSITHDQRRAKSSATVRNFRPVLIVRHRAWYHTMEQRSSRRESRRWFFFFLSRVVEVVNSGDLVLAPTGSDFCMTAHHISVHFHCRRTRAVTVVLHQPVTYQGGAGNRHDLRFQQSATIHTVSPYARWTACLLASVATEAGYLLYLYPRVEESSVLV